MTCLMCWYGVHPDLHSFPTRRSSDLPLTARVASGIKVARVRFWLEQGTWEPVASMLREELGRAHVWTPGTGGSRMQGSARNSEEVPVMGMERRGPITPFRRRVNPVMG